MPRLRVHLYGNPLLRQKLKLMQDKPENFSEIIDKMFNLMYKEIGAGLSANQVGLDISFFIVDFSLQDKNMSKKVFINPEILEMEGQSILDEGCLSLPGIREKIKRAEKIKVRYENRDREQITEEYTGLPARIIQHEYDHLNGKFIVDRISSLKKSFLKSKLARISTEEKESVD